MVKKIASYVIALCMVFSGLSAWAAEMEFNGQVVESFEAKDYSANWQLINSGIARLDQSRDQHVSGNNALKFTYNYTTSNAMMVSGFTSTNWREGGMKIKNSKQYNYFGVWVYGDNSNLHLAVDIMDASNQGTVRYGFTTIDFEGWKYIEFDISDNNFAHDISIYQIVVQQDAGEPLKSGVLYFDDITFSAASYYADEQDDDSMAGMFGISDIGGEQVPKTPTLAEVDQPIVERTKPQPAQLGNENPLMVMNYRQSKDIPNSLSGVAYGDEGTILDMSRDVRAVEWGTAWINDGDALRSEGVNTTFSSGMHRSAEANEWVMLTFDAPKTIQQINVIPRDKGAGFPIDFRLEVSSDGETWTAVADVKDYEITDPKEDMDRIPYTFDPVTCQYVRMVATKLSAESASVYYFQVQEIEALDAAGNNVALYTNGTTALASNPLTSNEVIDFDTYFDNVFDAGIKWVNVINTDFFREYQAGEQKLGFGEKENLKFLQENGVNVTYRFAEKIGELSDEEAKAKGEEFADAVELYVRELKDYVHVWQISNEENWPGETYGEQRPKGYAIVVSAVADRIKSIDPDAKIEIETALIDFGWTESVLQYGLKDKIDIVGVHVYKEISGAENIPEGIGTYPLRGVRMFPDTHPYADYREEIGAYKELLAKYNPNIELWCTETSVNVGSGTADVSERSQAKYLAREYIYHYMLDVGPTCWWTLGSIKTGTTEWGLIDSTERKRDGWYALRNVSNTFDYSYQKTDAVSADFGGKEDIVSDVFMNEQGVALIPYWSLVSLRDTNTGEAVDITLSGIDVKDAVCVDMFTGAVQTLEFEQTDTGVVFRNMVSRDYPMVIKINAGETYQPYPSEGETAEEPDTKPEQPVETAAQKIVKNAIIIKTDENYAFVRNQKTPLSSTIDGVTPIIIDGVAYVPARFLTENLNKNIYWLDGLIVISDTPIDVNDETIRAELLAMFQQEGGN